MLSGIAYVLMLLDFPLPFFPSFLKVDFSDIPALIAAIIMGPGAGVAVEMLKNVLDLLTTGSQTGVPVGHIANFVTGTLFILPTYFMYNRVRTKKGMAMGLFTATAISAFAMSILNYYVFLPMYEYFMGFHLPAEIVVMAILPFNLLKGVMISAVFMVLFVKMNNWLIKERAVFTK
ncbi:ECF transporter S component [Fervidibacillus albus]|uniref:Riboflavin transporter n=2 Tax=Fervidibacillus albus TaxID=2980026 RepID=A0A9E8LWX6_9BACI|nr:ECF transporter S component [Fervidibacillus albus]WAA11233.1 ECF transporter S component [Fervidibacillus albus]